jgi:hypothetical protein
MIRMIKTVGRNALLVLLIIWIIAAPTLAQAPPIAIDDHQIPVSTQWLLNSTSATQRTSINSVYMLACPKTNKKGTGFLILGGIIITDNHVVEGCNSADLVGTSSTGTSVASSKMVTDPIRDLALLRPTHHIEGGLILGDDASMKVEDKVTTWGFPLTYNGPAPVLSVGYLSGYQANQVGDKTVRHLVVNGAFNPGNSGGPLLSSKNTVVGVVVWNMRVLAPVIQVLIDGLRKSNSWVSSGVVQTLPNGTTKNWGQHEVTAAVLQEFYDHVQVMIGEATAVTELKEFIREKGAEVGFEQPRSSTNIPQ